MSDGGKGSAPRPVSIPREDFAARWDAIFGTKCQDCGRRLGNDPVYIHTCTPPTPVVEGEK